MSASTIKSSRVGLRSATHHFHGVRGESPDADPPHEAKGFPDLAGSGVQNHLRRRTYAHMSVGETIMIASDAVKRKAFGSGVWNARVSPKKFMPKKPTRNDIGM